MFHSKPIMSYIGYDKYDRQDCRLYKQVKKYANGTHDFHNTGIDEELII